MRYIRAHRKLICGCFIKQAVVTCLIYDRGETSEKNHEPQETVKASVFFS